MRSERRLCARAKDVRSEIELAGKKAVEAIETRVLQKLQEVEDIECARHKVLDGEHDRVKKLCEDAKRAVEFGSRLVKKEGTDNLGRSNTSSLACSWCSGELFGNKHRALRHSSVA